jgi:alkylation response protein AidB-like acyl-CoA dehydrogenase
VSLGLARGALDELQGIADTKVPTFSREVVAERPLAQAEIAHAEATFSAARAFVRAAVDDAWQMLRKGEAPTQRQVADMRVAAANAADAGAAVTRTCSTFARGSAIFKQSPFQRHMRDGEAIAHHFSVSPYVWEDAGRVYLGRAPTAPMF